MSTRRRPHKPGQASRDQGSAPQALDNLDLRRHSAARAGLVALGIGAGTGVLTALLIVLSAAGPSPETPGSLRVSNVAVILLLGLLIGIAAGAVLAIPASLATLVLRPTMIVSRGRARLVAGVLGAAGALTLALAVRFWLLSSEFVDRSLLWYLLIPAVVTVAASALAGPWVANRQVSRRRPGTPRSDASPRQ